MGVAAQAAAFEQVRGCLAAAPTLSCPDFSEPFTFQTDASSTGLGAVLSQLIKGEERVIAFASRALSDAERRYSITEQECLAVVWAIKKFRPYLEGYQFMVVTDHSSLRWLHNLQNPTGRLARWALELLEYDYEVVYRKGALHHAPDAFSRIYEGETSAELVAVAMSEIDPNIIDRWYVNRYKQVSSDPKRHPT